MGRVTNQIFGVRVNLLGVLVKNISCKVHVGQHILMWQKKICHMWFSLNFLHFRLKKNEFFERRRQEIQLYLSNFP